MNKKAFGLRGRHSHNPAFRTKVALAVLREDRTMGELCKEFEACHVNLRLQASTVRARR